MKFSSSVWWLVSTAVWFSQVHSFVLDTKSTSRRLSSVSLEATATPDRRTFVGSAACGLLSLVGVAVSPTSAASTAVDYPAVASEIRTRVQTNPNDGPTLVRLAWHTSGTYDRASKTGGSYGGTMRFKEEYSHGANAGLADTAIAWMEQVKAKYPAISYGDLYTLAGVVAIQTMGGPTIPWSSGRVDAPDSSAVTPDGRLPAADSGPPGADPQDSNHLRQIFGRMGFDDQEIVALSGAHALGRCHTTASGYDGPWTPTPTTWNNAYFTLLQSLDWKARDWSGPFQYEAGPKGSLMMLPTDLVLLQDSKFAKYVQLYAKNGQKFDQDFSKAFQKLEELGTKNLTPTKWSA